MVWDESSVLSASADKSIRYYDLTEAREQGEEYRGVVMKGHMAGVT
jgi:hypothetical protein